VTIKDVVTPPPLTDTKSRPEGVNVLFEGVIDTHPLCTLVDVPEVKNSANECGGIVYENVVPVTPLTVNAAGFPLLNMYWIDPVRVVLVGLTSSVRAAKFPPSAQSGTAAFPVEFERLTTGYADSRKLETSLVTPRNPVTPSGTFELNVKVTAELLAENGDWLKKAES
jgi:hypothetical protein